MKTFSEKYSPAIKYFVMLFTLTVFFNSPINAAQIPDPTLTQKNTIDQMHHKLHDDQASIKAKEARALKELNEMTIRENVKIDDVNAKIDELMAARNQILRLRHAHLIEMRKSLTDEQKVGYDKALLQRSAVK